MNLVHLILIYLGVLLCLPTEVPAPTSPCRGLTGTLRCTRWSWRTRSHAQLPVSPTPSTCCKRPWRPTRKVRRAHPCENMFKKNHLDDNSNILSFTCHSHTYTHAHHITSCHMTSHTRNSCVWWTKAIGLHRCHKVYRLLAYTSEFVLRLQTWCQIQHHLPEVRPVFPHAASPYWSEPYQMCTLCSVQQETLNYLIVI